MRWSVVLSAAFWVLNSAPVVADSPIPFKLNDGDRVVLVGNGLIEREQRYGYWETMLTSLHPAKSITFRNLGWSGDTVFGDARAGFDTPADGFRRLKEQVLAAKPTVIIVGYGLNESFEGEAGLPRFVDGLNKLLDTLAETKARFILLGPNRHEDLGRHLPDPTEHNRKLRLYRDAIRRVAEKRGCLFVDLYEATAATNVPLTDDGIHLTAGGYLFTARAIAQGLGLKPPRWLTSARIWPESHEVEELRKEIIGKNLLYFHRWRPQNETYLYGFRKHEQGQNSKEIPQFDPLIAEAEAKIARRIVTDRSKIAPTPNP